MSATTKAVRRILIVDDDRPLRYALAALLQNAGYVVEEAADGPEALTHLQEDRVDLMLLDIGLPSVSGLEVLKQARLLPAPPLVVIMTADDTPETLLGAVRGQAYRYLRKPFAPNAIEVVSARPEWVELVAPCALAMTDRLQAFVMQLETNLPDDVRESVGQAFRELLANAIEWGGRLDPTRKVRISCIRARRMLLYRISDPGEGFDIERLRHAAICNPDDNPLEHALVREAQGLRPGGLGIAITRSLVDELIYNEARNEVVFVKYLD
jgi:CheY-like chemotaxis protein